MERLTLHAISLISQLVPLWDLDAYHEHEILPCFAPSESLISQLVPPRDLDAYHEHAVMS
jgi:hypothetical protein